MRAPVVSVVHCLLLARVSAFHITQYNRCNTELHVFRQSSSRSSASLSVPDTEKRLRREIQALEEDVRSTVAKQLEEEDFRAELSNAAQVRVCFY
jgi:tRNA pseudouridine-54 N-methylase